MYPRVAGVISQQGRDLSTMANRVADRYGYPPRVNVACWWQESRLDEHSERRRAWPDVSAGLAHQTVKYAVSYGLGDGSDTPANIESVFAILKHDVKRAADIAGRQLGYWWRVTGGDVLNTLAKYNRPASTIENNANAQNIRDSWAVSAQYLEREAPVDITVYDDPGSAKGAFTARPCGIVLHGSRSGRLWSTQQEFNATRNYARQADDSWHVTVGDDAYSRNVSVRQRAQHARAANTRYLGCEFAQPTRNHSISDAQVRAFVAWYWAEVVPVWGEYAVTADQMPTHAELERRGETSVPDGKDDAFPAGDPRANDLRARIAAALAGQEGEDMSRIAELEQQLAAEREWSGGLATVMKNVRGELDAALALREMSEIDIADAERAWGRVRAGRDELARHE